MKPGVYTLFRSSMAQYQSTCGEVPKAPPVGTQGSLFKQGPRSPSEDKAKMLGSHWYGPSPGYWKCDEERRSHAVRQGLDCIEIHCTPRGFISRGVTSAFFDSFEPPREDDGQAAEAEHRRCSTSDSSLPPGEHDQFSAPRGKMAIVPCFDDIQLEFGRDDRLAVAFHATCEMRDGRR